MAIFLHFLNREAYRAANTEYSIADIERILRILTIARYDELFSNFANLLEGGFLADSRPSLLRELLRQDHLLVAGERPSLPEFMESRTTRYAFDAQRYPMYFAAPTLPEGFQPRYIPRVSLTEHLRAEITSLVEYKKDFEKVGVGKFDFDNLAASLSDLHKIVQLNESSGITRSLFAGKLGDQQRESAAARLISTIYIRKYQSDLDCDIVTGIPALMVFDHLATDAFSTNLNVFIPILGLSGFSSKLDLGQSQYDLQLVSLRGSDYHNIFVNKIKLLCKALSRIFPNTNSTKAHIAAKAVLSQVFITPRKLVFDQTLYEISDYNLSRVFGSLCERNKKFSEAYEKQMQEDGIDKIVLLVTATEAESRALFEIAEKVTHTPRTIIRRPHYVARELGHLNQIRLIHVQCEPGSVGPSSSQAVITDAINDFSPHAVILGGIAFGTNSSKQKLGDVLVSKTIVEYEKVKCKEAGEIPRGQRVESSSKLLSVFRAAAAEKLHPNVHIGVMLSGEKLIDSDTFLSKLLKREPEAIGGEMEGAGLVAAAQRSGTNWIVVKAIVDWASNKEAQNSADHQIETARGAFQFILQTLEKIGI